MRGIDGGGVGIGTKTSLRHKEIDKAQAELRQERDVREARQRELEFLENGGNPLDFKCGYVSVSLQSTSLNARHLDPYLSGEAQGSFAVAASPHGDSFESSGRPAASVHGQNNVDNPLKFAGKNDMSEGGKNTTRPGRKNTIISSEQSSLLTRKLKGKEMEDSAIFRPYARRNRSRSNRGGGRLNSADAVHSPGVGCSVASRAGLRDGKGSLSERNSQKDQNAHITLKSKIESMDGYTVSWTSTSDNRLDGKIGVEQDLLSTSSLKHLPGDKFEATTRGSKDNRPKQSYGNRKSSADAARADRNIVQGYGSLIFSKADALPSISRERDDVKVELNGSGDAEGEVKDLTGEIQDAREAINRKDLQPGTYPEIGIDHIENNDACDDAANASSSGVTVEQLSDLEKNQNLVDSETFKEKSVTMIIEGNISDRKENETARLNQTGDGAATEAEKETNAICSLPLERYSAFVVEGKYKQQKEKTAGDTIEDGNEERSYRLVDDVSSTCEAPTTSLSGMEYVAPPDKISLCNNSNSVDKVYEDSVLEEALIIQAKHKRIAELSVHSLAVESRQRSLWDFVLEEMTWLANDFAQERLWKMTAAAQLCHRIASVSRLRYEEQRRQWKLKTVAHSLSKAVMQFWRSAEALLNIDETHSGLKDDQLECMGLQKKNNVEVSEGNTGDHNMQDSCQKLPVQNPDESTRYCIQGYALRFLRYNKSQVYQVQVEMPKTPDTVSHMDIMELSWNDDLTEERLFYVVPSGAMEIYRRFIESYVAECEKTGGNIKEDVDTSVFTTVADKVYQEIGYDEDEAGSGRFYLPGAFDGKQLSKFIIKKRKNPTGLYDPAADLHYGQYGSHPSMKKRPANFNVNPVSTKRIRTTYRQRGLFGPGLDAGAVIQAKNEVSSGDTNSFHDDLNILHGGSHTLRGMEVESAEIEKDLPYEFTETSPKPKKKKKKKKKKDSTAEWGWHLGFAAQREHSKKRLEHFGSNGTSGFFGQHHAKKPKMMKQCLDNSYDNTMAMNGSIPASMASQMSKMSNPKRLMKLIGGHDRSRKVKALKTSSLHSGSGSPWSLFEDQALVVLVHDMGPNWELVSDAINSTLQFKCIFRKPKECKDRHKILMDKTASDGADSADDSRTSQSYPSTLPGIPKGSARQLFQRLQSPVEEDALMEHFDIIVQIVQRRHRWRIQSKNENQDGKLIAVHNSHFVALSQGPNNLGRVFLTPLDLIEATPSNPDALPIHNYQGSHASTGMSIQGAASSVATTVPNSSLPGSPSGFPSTTTGSPSGPLSAPFRDGRYIVPKASPSPGDEQQRLHDKPMLSNRTVPQSKSGSLSGSDCGVHALPGGSGLGMASGMSRTLPVSRPAFQGMGSSPVLNSDTVMGMPDPVNTYSGSGACKANSMLRPREPSKVVKGGQNADHSREMSLPERQMHVNHNAEGIPPFNGSGSAFSSPKFPGIPQQHQVSPKKPNPQLPRINHPPGPHSKQQLYLKLAKDRIMQPQYLQQQSASSNMRPHVQTQPQFPISSPLQNIAPTQPPPPQSMPSSSPMASTQNQPKNQLLPHGPARNMIPSVVGLKQRQPQQQQFQQPWKNHPQQRQQEQVHQGNLLKGVNRGSMLIQKKLPIDPSHLNGLSGAGKNSFQSSKPKSSQNTPVQQQKSQVPSLTKNSIQGTALMASNQQQGQQNQAVQTKRIPQNYQLPIKFMSEKVQGDQKFMPLTTPVDSSTKVTAVASSIHMQSKLPEAVHDPGLPSKSDQGVSAECPTLPSSISGILPNVLDTSSQSGNTGVGLESRSPQQNFPQSKQSPSPLPPTQQLEEQSLQQQTVVQGNTHVRSTNL